jgi:hypothetical protein
VRRISAAFRIDGVASGAWGAPRPESAMPVPAYTLRIRDRAGDDSHWQEEHIVAPSLADALAQARERFGEERVLAIAQDVDAEAIAGDVEPAAIAVAAPVAPAVPEPRIVPPHPGFGAFATAGGPALAPRAPMPWEGRWRPSVLVWSGAIAGLRCSPPGTSSAPRRAIAS